MGDTTKIQWTDHTFNPWIGCAKVSEGCKFCYAEQSTPTRIAREKGVELWGHGKERQRTSHVNWKLPYRWNINGGMVFCASLADWLDDEVPIQWFADLLEVIRTTPNLTWQLLTKRPQNWDSRIQQAQDYHFDQGDRNTSGWLSDWRKSNIAPNNVWIGVSCEDQQ